MKKKLSFIFLLLALILGVFSTIFISNTYAEDNGIIYVHFYNGEGTYSYDEWGGKANVSWGAYYWVDSGKVVASVSDDEDFSREVDGVKNVGKLFKISLNASETKAVSQGKKLGLIMVRSYIDELGYLTPYWNNNTGKDLSSDRYLEVSFNSNNEYNIWIIAGDKNNYTSLDSAKSAFERIESANFDDFNNIIFQSTKVITSETNITLYKITDAINNPDGEVLKQNLHASDIWNDGLRAKISNLNLESGFDWNADYQLYIEEVSAFRTSVTKTRLYLSDKFNQECVPGDMNFGAIYTKEKTTFRVWAPISTNVLVNFYRNGNELDTTLYSSAKAMTKKTKGVWELEVSGDLNGVYYTYTNYVSGEVNETVDIYATAVGVNGNRAMVCDLDSTNPDGWTQDLAKATSLRTNNSDLGVIWEIHVRDFSISADSGLTYKGKYLAFTEENTYAKGSDTIKTGINYLKDLGVTYIHLNPVYDFATVDEEYINNTDYTTKQNWGYDPKNYNVPEGSYATNAENGEVRINEFKQMVKALHDAGIGVIMDVVYNHTYTADSYFEKMVPGYYYRQALSSDDGTFGYHSWTLNALGAYNLSDGSGCSNETASERAMYRQYMINSLTYWASEYHIDGFRFDLMAIHDVYTMNQIRNALDELPGGRGILLYGEPWAAGALGLDTSSGKVSASASSDNLNLLDERIAAFNDRMREGIKGNNDGGTGYVQNNNDEGIRNKVKAGINGLFLNYSGDGVVSDKSSHTITYTTSHDNYTLWDQLVNTTIQTKSPTIYSERNIILEKKNMMAATLVLTSKGTSFILAGEEIARTKYGNHNSYNAQDKINAFDYNRQEEFSELYNWYKSLIELRTRRFTSMAKGTNQALVTDFYGCLVYRYNKEITSDEYSSVTILMNPNDYEMEIKTSELTGVSVSGSWRVIADENGFNFNSTKTVSGNITLPAYSTYIIVQ